MRWDNRQYTHDTENSCGTCIKHCRSQLMHRCLSRHDWL